MPRLPWWAARLLVAALPLPLLLSCRSRSAQRPATAAPPWLLERARQEAALAAHSSAFHDFRFTDRPLPADGRQPLHAQWLVWHHDDAARGKAGKAGKKMVLAGRGAAERTTALVLELVAR